MPREAPLLVVGIMALNLVGGADAAEEFDPGLPVGASIPSFELADQAGQARSFEDLRGADGLALLFFRSADW